MLRRASFSLFLPAVLISISASACSHAQPTRIEAPREPRAVHDLDDFEAGFNELALVPEGDPSRAKHRAALEGFLLTYLDGKLARNGVGEAVAALKYSLGLYTPKELRTAEPSPALAERAHAIYRAVGKRGAERPAFLALAIEQRFGDDVMRARAVEHWRLLETWTVENSPFAVEPLLRHEDLEDALEDVAAVFPTPFVVERLADLYVARYILAQKSRTQGRSVDANAERRMEFTGYLLMRLYLRADDFEGALAAMERVELDMPVAKLRDRLVDAMKPRKSALPLLGIAEQFMPEPDAHPGESFVVQGWGIVDNVSRRAVATFPNDPYAHVLRARSLRSAGLNRAAITHLRRALDLKADVFEAWETLAALEQEQLEALADDDPEAAVGRLEAIEALHQRAAKLWSDRPIEPGLPEALYTVAEGLYQAGHVGKAEALLERSLGLEAVPNTIDLLGTIALKRSQLAQARQRYENLASLAYENKTAALQWEARARAQLGEIAVREGDVAASKQHILAALRHTNDLLARSTMDPGERSDRYVERGKLLFLLGDLAQAMEDFHQAAEMAPGSVKAYIDPMRYVVEHGYHEEARSIFRRAIHQTALPNMLKLYFSLWMNELALRQGESDPEAMRFLGDFDGDRWGQLLARHALGRVGYEQLLAGANDRGEQAEAYFYEGLRRWRSGDPEGGKALLQKVLATDMMGFLEYDMAQTYLDWDDVPRTARPPLPASAALHKEGPRGPSPVPAKP